MSRDREAVVWSRLAGHPVRIGRLYLTDADCRFTYDPDYLHTGLPGLGLVYAPQIYRENTIIRRRTAFFDFLPPIQSLIPPQGERNFQRRLILAYLARAGIVPARGLDEDWEILKVAGHGAIGHLDIFESDEKARVWYAAPADSGLFEITPDLGFSLKAFLTWFDQEADIWLHVIGPTPSIGGAIPKLLVSIPESGWDGRIGLPSRPGVRGLTDVVLKFEQTATYPGIIELEALALAVHREAGFEVPRFWMAEINGIPALAVERFDRDAVHKPVFTESLYSVLASGDASVTNNYSYTYDRIGRAFDRSPITLVSDPVDAKRHLLQRLVMALLTGNGDLHLENLSIIDRGEGLRFSPVYDPTPMRAYSIHNMLAVMPFGDYGEFSGSRAVPVGFTEALLNFTRSLGIGRTVLRDVVSASLEATRDYHQRVAVLRSLPDANKRNLIAITRKLASLLETVV
jgi:serine/threonine-protein kinase HipA